MGVDPTRSPFYEAFGDDAALKLERLERLTEIAERLDAGTATAQERDEALHIVVDLTLGRSGT